MADPCGIVDTIQDNFKAIEYGKAGDSGVSGACLGAQDTTTGTALLEESLDKRENDGTTSPKNKERGEEEKLKVAAGDDPDDDVTNDTSGYSGKTKESSNAKKKGGLLSKWTSPRKKIDQVVMAEKEDEKEGLEAPKMAPVSDLSDPGRKICVVTTAGVPWRTGTAVNPLARALYLTRGRPKHSITLMIPWLETREEQAKIYGSTTFETPEDQEAWTRQYARERILNAAEEEGGTSKAGIETGVELHNQSTDDEADNLQIRFYPAKYHNLLGSIFATVDICALVPQEDADVAILEEPEHLTWFRSLPPSSSSGSSVAASAMESMMDNDNSCGSCAAGQDEEKIDNENDEHKDNSEVEEQKKLEELAIIGWTAKFSYVVGILHTNYSAYMRQYGLGASIVTASALQALSSVCVRAYTHRLIRLSDTLPELDKTKEITCNVHGVRSEFFVVKEYVEEAGATNEASLPVEKSEDPKPDNQTERKGTKKEAVFENDSEMGGNDGINIETMNRDDNISDTTEERFLPESVYFIGKVIWAKGFDKLLEIEDLFRKETGEYFPIDVYGSGGDFEAISRAFLGRSGLAKRVTSSGSVKSLENGQTQERSKSPVLEKLSPTDQTAALLFSKEGSLRGQIEDLQTIPSDELIVEVQTCETPINDDVGTPRSKKTYPKRIIGHLGEKTRETGTGVTKAITKLSEKITNLGFHSLYREEGDDLDTNDDYSTETGSSFASKFRFDPPKSRYELRRHAIPARFLGVKDHALLRDIKEHKIFINLSITEVLCTTTAEAMAMEKFVIIPEHPSNAFFLQFPNCLAFESKRECVEKIKFALENNPVPLSPEDKHKLTWEGANKRLYETSLITEAEAEERNKKTNDFARLHMETMKTGAFFQGLWSRGVHKKVVTREENTEDEVETDSREKNIMGICKA